VGVSAGEYVHGWYLTSEKTVQQELAAPQNYGHLMVFSK
jgi:hypothetical protein